MTWLVRKRKEPVMALNYANESNQAVYKPAKGTKRKPQKQIEAKDLVIINRKEFAQLWRKWSLNERKLHDAVVDLAYELSSRLEKFSLAAEASHEMMDLFYTDKEQNALFIPWEKEDDERYKLLKDENIKAAIDALNKLSGHQRSTVLAETDEIARGFLEERRGIHDLVPRLKDEDVKEIYTLITQKLGIGQ
jgi:hypothetical protein